MLYISGKDETFEQLKNKEEFAGSLADYQKQFAQLNPFLCSQNPGFTARLPSFCVMNLVTEPSFDPKHSAEVARIVNGYSLSERETLRSMQEGGYDIPTHVATVSVLEEFQGYVNAGKSVLSSPIFPTPVYEFNRSLTNKSLIKMSGEGLKQGAHVMETSPKFIAKANLMELMKKRDEVNHKWFQLRGKNGRIAINDRHTLEREAKELTSQIKKLIPKKITDNATKYIHGLPADQAIKNRAGSASLKIAKKGVEKMKLTHLERLNISGLAFQRNLIKGFKTLGNGVKKVATYTNYTLAGYEILNSFMNGGNVLRTAFKEGSALYASSVFSAATGGTLAGLGGIAIGMMAGNPVLGELILACYPVIGWVVLVFAGAATAGYVSYQTKDVAERVWDSVESGYVKDKVYEYAEWIYNEFKSLGYQIAENF